MGPFKKYVTRLGGRGLTENMIKFDIGERGSKPKGPLMGFCGPQDKTFFVCGIRDWFQNCCRIRDSDICRIRDWPQNYCGIRDPNILREWDKVSYLFSILEMCNLHLNEWEIA